MKEDMNISFDAPIIVHIACVSLIVLLGTLGNGTIIRASFKRNRYDKGNKLILALAYIDLFACYSLAFFVVFIDIYDNLFQYQTLQWLIWSRFKLSRFLILGHIGLMTSLTIERIWAVCFPYRYNAFERNINAVVCIPVLLAVLEAIVSSIVYSSFGTIILFTFIILGVSFILITYLFLACKLYLRQRRRIDLMPDNQMESGGIELASKHITVQNLNTNRINSQQGER